ncbi:hypothetical protein C4D60_Mb09t03040 [Musa balbisiana]|uniref:CASP-like protein n=1 Tax=Musa balbisiana TaxID=52838 RepID=A0A4S8IDM6_MUSBA|nr:hypothetical protein C4D60_Mb09t03040 [Musa balbisiana]
MPSPLRNGDAAHPRLPSPAAATPLHHYNHNHNHNYPSFRSTVSEQKIRRLNLLILLLRLAAFCFSLSAAVFTAANSSRSASSPYSWLSVDSFRVMFAANAIVAVYSLLEIGCTADKPAASFCVQAYISVALGFAGFAFLALSALVSGFRVASYVLTGSRFPLQ